MGSYIDPISYIEYPDNSDFLLIGQHKYHPHTIRMLIIMADLGIHIDNATEEEFVLTAKSDRVYNIISPNFVNPFRLRNPMTNLPFTTLELQYIYRKIAYEIEV
jgi:hypothetical protein